MKRFLINLTIISALIFTGSNSFAKDIKFIQLTDTHYALNNNYITIEQLKRYDGLLIRKTK